MRCVHAPLVVHAVQPMIAEQEVQDDAPANAKVPVRHAVHVPAPYGAYVPASHGVHMAGITGPLDI